MADPVERARATAGPLWFLADREAFLRRFVLRTLMEPPRARRPLRWVQPRPIPSPSPHSHPIPSPRLRGEG